MFGLVENLQRRRAYPIQNNAPRAITRAYRKAISLEKLRNTNQFRSQKSNEEKAFDPMAGRKEPQLVWLEANNNKPKIVLAK